MTEHRAARALRKLKSVHGSGWRLLSRWAADNPEMMESTPSWCLLPEQAYYDINHEISKTYVPIIPIQEQVIRDVNTFRFLSLWRLSKGIYRVSPDLMRELVLTKMSGDIPTDALMRLPEWCIYIELDGAFEAEPIKSVVGAWVSLLHDLETGDSTLVIAFDIDADMCGESPTWPHDLQVMICLYDLGAGTVDAAALKCHEEMEKSVSKYEIEGTSWMTLDFHSELLSTTMNVLLYICSSEPDIEDHEEPDAKPTRARMQRMGKRDIFVAADRVRIWNVGDKVGEMIRNYNEDPADRKHTRRHLRRAHWHGYWTGKRNSEEREFSYKWLSPMVVGVSA